MDATSTFDPNFCLPLPELGLETARVKLVPFVPQTHDEEFYSQVTAHPELSKYLPAPFTPTIMELILHDTSNVLFAILDKTRRGAFAGIIGLLHTSPQNMCTEIGPVFCFPEFQRTFVTSNAVGILLRWCLNLSKDGGLGFRRVQWMAHTDNAASIRLAERMGFKPEGTMRWTWVLVPGSEGLEVPEERGVGLGRHSAVLGAYWDDWENGGREQVDKVVNRQS